MLQPVGVGSIQAVASRRPTAVAPQGASATSESQAPAAEPPAPSVPTPAAAVQVAAAAIPNAPNAYGADAARKPLSISVDKGDSGVFVYTLRDPDSGAVVSVIPRQLLQQGAGRKVDTSA